MEEISQEPGSGPLKLSAHRQLRAVPEAQEELHQKAAQVGQQGLLAAGTSIKEVGPPFLVPPQPTPTEPVPTPLRHAGLSSDASLGTRFRLLHAALPSAGSPHAHAQVQEGLQVLRDKQEQVFQAWEQKQERLQARNWELLFLRKCGHLDETLTAREAGALTP